jgi:hypothetical protein
MTDRIWAIALVEPNRDFEVDLRLRRSGYRVVFLTYRRQLTGHNKPGWRQASDFIGVPLISGYLFVELHEGQPFPDPERINGYYGLLGGGKARLTEEVIAKWREDVNSGKYDDVRRPAVIALTGPRKFLPANSPEERRKLFEARFAAMLEPDALEA